MNFLMAVSTVVLLVCGIALAALILFHPGKEERQAGKMLTRLMELKHAGNSLMWAVPQTGFDNVIQKINERLAVRVVDNRYSIGSQPRRGSVQTARPSDPVRQFLKNLRVCEQERLRFDPPVIKWAWELEKNGKTRSATLTDTFWKNTANILRALIHLSDYEMDRQRKNETLQAAFREMAGLAELSFIEPVEGDRLDEEQHQPVGTLASPGKIPGRIASFTRRGLIRPGTGEVILHAYVILYK